MSVSPESEPSAKPENWRAGSLRITAFCVEPPDLGTVRWWESIAGHPSETKNILRSGIGQLVEYGPVGDQVLQLQVQLNRVDWILFPKENPEGDPFPFLGEIKLASLNFRSLVDPWLAQAPRLNRVAFGAQLYIPVRDHKEAMRLLAKKLPSVKINWEAIRDFTFQVNRPLPGLSEPDLGEINRLTKWQVVVQKKVVGVILPTVQAPHATSEQTSAFWELDINTAVPTDPTAFLAPNRVTPLIDELIQNAIGIVKDDVL